MAGRQGGGIDRRSAGRIYRCGGMWYFHTREMMDQGPFYTLYEAETSLEDYVITMSSGYLPIDQIGEFEPLFSGMR